MRKNRARPRLCALKTLTAVSRLGNLALPRLLIPYVVNAKETKIINYVEPLVARPLILHGSAVFQPHIFPSPIGLHKVQSVSLVFLLSSFTVFPPLYPFLPMCPLSILTFVQFISQWRSALEHHLWMLSETHLSPQPSQENQTFLLWSSWWRKGYPFNRTAILRPIKDFPTCKQTLSKSCAEWICDSGWHDIKSLSMWGWYTESEPGVFPQEHRENIQLPENE